MVRIIDRLAAKGKHVMLITCPIASCRSQVVVNLASDRARCSKCGNEWKWNQTHLIRGERGK